jgi:Fe-S oxidoreductase
LQELYGIEKAAASLAALIEGQNQKRREFELELASQKEQLKEEIEATRAEWEQEQKARETEVKERELTEKKARDREKEDYAYAIKREQQAIKDKLNDEKALLEKEIKLKREAAEKDLTEREKVIVEREKDLAQMRERVAAFPKELQEAVNKAVAEVTARLTGEAKTREELLRKECEGERNVFKTRVEGLEKTIKDLGERNARLTQQLDAAYQKVQEIAEKAIEGSSQSKSYAELQKLLSEQSRRPAPDKS